eukprot:jgi/Chlat1/3773/Chrsp259S03911
MAAVATSAVVCSVARPVAAPKRSFNGAPVARKSAAAPSLPSRRAVVMSADKKVAAPALTAASLAIMTALPDIAMAVEQPGVTPSLKNLLFSVLAGGTVLGLIAVAVAGVSSFDQVKRR